jgi:hypothetical protein
MEIRIAGVFLLPTGWLLMLAAILMLPSLPGRTVFALLGLAVEVFGLALLVHSYLPARKVKHNA